MDRHSQQHSIDQTGLPFVEPREQILTRMYVVLSLIALIPVLVVVQLVKLGLFEGSQLREAGTRQAESVKVIPALRGMILDKNGRVLATNQAAYELAVDPEVPGFSQRAGDFQGRMARLTGRRAAYFGRQFRKAASPRYVLVARGLTEQQKNEIDSWDIPGVVLTPAFTRRLSYRQLGAHLIGHVDVDGRGTAGVELAFDTALSGIDGQRTVQRDRNGHIKAIVDGPVVDPQHGEHVVLTIDLVKQAIMEEELAVGVKDAGAAWGVAVAMDPKTGAVLGMANYPTYDPNRPADYPESNRRNRAITDRIEPGSTFKLVTAVAAVDKGIITLDDTVDTGDGRAVINGRTMRDTHKNGRIPFREVISKSSNIGTAKTALRLDPGVFYQYARNLGFGQLTGISIPGEVSGSLKKPQDWSGITLPWMSHGYEVEATPLQILAAYSAFANGGVLMRPYVVAERRDVFGRTVWTRKPEVVRRAFKQSTADALLPAFEAVVDSGGTAERAAVEGLRIAGKTGTAQKVEGGRYARGKYRASFVGFFPAEDPQVAIIVILDEPKKSGYGGVVAAPIFGQIAKRWISSDPSLAPELAAHERPVLDEMVEVPEIRGIPLIAARSFLTVNGLKADRYQDVSDPFALVSNLAPEVGTGVARETRVEIRLATLDDSEDRAANLDGLSCRHAVNWLLAENKAVQVLGSGRVTRVSYSRNQTTIRCN
ncbi:MAG: penicillin-binding transpeptidase domain-containing protein [Rhodothermia bacterium]